MGHWWLFRLKQKRLGFPSHQTYNLLSGNARELHIQNLLKDRSLEALLTTVSLLPLYFCNDMLHSHVKLSLLRVSRQYVIEEFHFFF